MIHWVFIGCGDVTEKKSGPAFGKAEGSDVAAVMRRDGEKAKDYARRHNIAKWFTDANDLINDSSVDAVYVATPPGSHAQYAIAAMRVGKPVYVEKPMAASFAECQEMLRVCHETNVPCFVAYYRRSLPYFLRIKQLICSDALGEICNVQIRFSIPPRPADRDRDNLPWRVKRERSGAGYFYDLASHQFDLLDFLLGPVSDAAGFSANRAGLYEAEDTVSAAFRFSRGFVGSGSWGFAASENEETDAIDIFGTKGRLSFSTFRFSPIVLHTPSERREFEESNPENIQFYLIRSVVDYLKGKGEMPVSTCETAIRTNWVMDKILGRI